MDFSTGGITSWNWSFPGGTPSSSTGQNPVVTYSQSGIYDVQLIVSNGTTSDTLVRTSYITVDATTGAGTLSQEMTCKIVPNPSNGNFKVIIGGIENQVVNLTLYSLTGVPVYRLNALMIDDSAEVNLSLSSLPQGLYFLSIEGDEGRIIRKVLVTE
jgi:PKD repeat protein